MGRTLEGVTCKGKGKKETLKKILKKKTLRRIEDSPRSRVSTLKEIMSTLSPHLRKNIKGRIQEDCLSLSL